MTSLAMPVDFEAPAPISSGDWDMPVAFDSLDPPSFPIDALPSWGRAWCEAESTALQVPLDLPAILFLGVCALCIAKKRSVRVAAGWDEPANLYMLIALGPGEGKSPAFSRSIAPILEWEAQQRDAVARQIADAKEQRQLLEERGKRARQQAARARGVDAARHVQEAREIAVELSELRIPALPRLVADDATPEAVGRLLAEHGGRLGVFSSEGGGPLAILAGRYSEGQPNLELFCKAYSGDYYTLDRVGRPSLEVRSPHLCVALTVQPSVLTRLGAAPELRGQGLLARFLYAVPKSRVGTRDPNPAPTAEPTKAAYNAAVRQLLELRGAVAAGGELVAVVIELSPAGRDELIAFKGELEPRLGADGDLHAIADWGNKLPGMAARLACVLHVAAHASTSAREVPLVIERATMLGALAIARYAIDHARVAFAQMRTDPVEVLARSILAWLIRHGKDRASQREIHRGVQAHVGRAGDLQAPLQMLVDRGYLRPLELSPTGGRPGSPTFAINPHTGK